MKFLMHKLFPILFAIGGVAWLVPVAKQLIKGEPINVICITSATSCFMLALILHVVGVAAARKAQAAPGPANTQPIPPA